MIEYDLTATQLLPNSVTKNHVYLFLKEQHLNNHYEDINLIFSNVTGSQIPDIRICEEQIRLHF